MWILVFLYLYTWTFFIMPTDTSHYFKRTPDRKAINFLALLYIVSKLNRNRVSWETSVWTFTTIKFTFCIPLEKNDLYLHVSFNYIYQTKNILYVLLLQISFVVLFEFQIFCSGLTVIHISKQNKPCEYRSLVKFYKKKKCLIWKSYHPCPKYLK